jgi:hypothetical protein
LLLHPATCYIKNRFEAWLLPAQLAAGAMWQGQLERGQQQSCYLHTLRRSCHNNQLRFNICRRLQM